MFFDPEDDTSLRPEDLVGAVTLGGLRERSLSVEERVLLVLTQPDWRRASRLAGAHEQLAWRPYRRICRGTGLAIALSPMGAPNVEAFSEELFAFGGRIFVLFGYCGALDGDMEPGDLILPTEALREEGTSYHYLPLGYPALPNRDLLEDLRESFMGKGLEPRLGKVWTTDALYRETRRKIQTYRAMGYLAVEMECAAFYSWATFRGARACSVLVVSDRFTSDGWQPFFGHPSFLMGRRRALKALVEALSGSSGR